MALWPSWGRPFGHLGPSSDAFCGKKSVVFRLLACKGFPKSAQASPEVENPLISQFFATISLRFSCCSSRQLRARSGYGGVAQRLQSARPLGQGVLDPALLTMPYHAIFRGLKASALPTRHRRTLPESQKILSKILSNFAPFFEAPKTSKMLPTSRPRPPKIRQN